MEVIFSHVLSASLQAAIAAIFIILVKKLFLNKVNIRIGYMLWAVLLVRLLIPVLPSAPVSIYNYVGYQEPDWLTQAKDTGVTSSLAGKDSSISGSAGSVAGAAASAASASSFVSAGSGTGSYDFVISATDNRAAAGEKPASPSSGKPAVDSTSYSPAPKLFSILAYIWAAGAFSTIIYLIAANTAFYVKIRKLKPITLPEELIFRLRSEMKLKESVKFVESNTISSPFVTGIFSHRVILPEGLIDTLDQNSLMNVIAHEFAHIKHRDLLFLWLSSLLCCLHWFNPIVWISAALVRQEQELCADAHVMSLLDGKGRLDYGETLLSIAKRTGQRHPSVVSAGISEGHKSLKSRIKSIAVFSNKKYRITLAGLLLIVLAVIFFCTSGYNYPKTADESMKFDDNVQFEVISVSVTNPRRFELRIHNFNKIAIHSCELGVYDGNPYKANSLKILGKSGFRIGAGQEKNFTIDNMDYSTAEIKFSFRYGYGPGSELRRYERSGNLQIFDKTAQINGWAAVTDEEVQQFIKENKLTPLAMNKVYNLLTIILFKNGSQSGYYELYKDVRTNKVIDRLVQGTEILDRQPVITRMGGTASGSFPYVCLRINDESIMKNGEKMELETEYGTKTEYLWGAGAYAIETRGFRSINKIAIYDRNGNRIYDGK